MKRLFMLALLASTLVVAFIYVSPLRHAGERAVGAGQSIFEAAGNAADTVGSVVDTGRQAADTISAARQLSDACDLVRSAVAPGTPPQESEAKLQEAMTIVSGVVTDYPNVPGVSDLSQGLTVARQALAADPSGKSLGVTASQVDSACSQIPSLP